jgi:uncharacterized protein
MASDAADRSEVSFPSGGLACAAWLYLPAGEPPYPCLVMAHGFAGTREVRLDAYAERFARAGIGALVFDYRHFGASPGEPRQLLDVTRQLEDWRAAIAFARARPELDAARVGLWGTSFSGGHVLTLGAEDPRLAAIVAQVPFCDPRGATRDWRLARRLLVAALRDALRGLLGRTPYEIPVVGHPGELAVLTSPDAMSGYRALVPAGSSWRNAVAARVLLQVPRYQPGKAASRIRSPLLVCVAEQDVLTPPGPALAAAARAPRASVRRYPCQHFEIYVGEFFERAVADQTTFLVEHLHPSPGAATPG